MRLDACTGNIRGTSKGALGAPASVRPARAAAQDRPACRPAQITHVGQSDIAQITAARCARTAAVCASAQAKCGHTASSDAFHPPG